MAFELLEQLKNGPGSLRVKTGSGFIEEEEKFRLSSEPDG